MAKGVDISTVSTDYEGRPAHRGFEVIVQGWNEEYVMLVIRSDDQVNEALITPSQLIMLAMAAQAEAPKW